MKLTQEQLNELFFEEEIEVDGITLKVVEEGDFEQDGKYQAAELIFTDGEKFYSGFISRSGSPFSDWIYDDWGDADITEVEKREVVVTKWVAV
ncbi:hypothetical protein [Bacillus subtilis]|uniref:hypothetical protein n=1 Tax=Bacillus subtilis TaxID=1423 RepID=UPI0024BF4910|nr:hypothetical protein [Bacillus subtilis]MDK1004054.1 hypothetical protein [Bacillus subtilis]